jgi:alkanesulfonate monooxygenase SsuD/methylene tetrahydromethanopterin reductase-like flavin-dependent oxidoreductase (luciferase family)
LLKMSAGLKLGAVCWGQYSTWPALLGIGRTVDDAGYHSLWCTDHLSSIHGQAAGPIFEGWAILAAWASVTRRVRLGLMVAANTFRPPRQTARLATTLDHISGGRAVLGIGAGWYEAEHRAFGLAFGAGPGERLRWLEATLRTVRPMLVGGALTEPPEHATPAQRSGDHDGTACPRPLQARLPILVGGGGERVTLRLVAQWADMNNVGGGIAAVRRKEAILREHCEAVGRDPDEIERTAGVGIVVIRSRMEDAERAYRNILAHNGGAQIAGQLVGTPADVAATLAPYLDIGYRHLVAEFPAPHDHESVERLVVEVRSMLGS